MRSISIISKLTGVTNNTEASEITLASPSIVELKAERSDIASIARSNQDMVITLRDGEVITVKNFYAFADQGGNQLVLEDSKGALWWVQDTDSAFHFEHINNIDELMVATGADSHGGAAIWPWVLGGVAVAGGIALAAGGGGGGSDNSNNGGNPNPPPPAGDTTPPAAPTNLNVSADGKTITGTAEPGSTVTITDSNGQVIGQGTAGSDGNFSIPLTNPQISGEDLTAHATDPSGNTGSDAVVVAPNIPLPDAPALTNVVDDVAPVTGTVPNTQSTNDNTPTLQGIGQAGTTVHIYDNGTEIGSLVVGADGSWSYTPTAALPDGSHTFTVTAINEKGESVPSASYTIIIDTVAPDAPVLDQLQDKTGIFTGAIGSGDKTDENRPGLNGTGEPGDTVTIFDNGVQVGQTTVGDDGKWNFTPSQPLADGSHTITMEQTDPAGNVSKTVTSPAFVVDHTPPDAAVITDVSVNGTTVTGTAEPGATVTITDTNNELLGTAQVGTDGTFTVDITPAQTHGESLTAHIHDAAGNVGPDTPFDASNSQLPTAPELDTITDDAGVSVGTLNNGQSTDDTTPTLSGTAEAGNTVTVYDNGVLIGSVVADGTGIWSFTPTALSDGPHEFTLAATNTFGISGTSAGFTVTVDTIAPLAPSDMLVSDDGLHVTGSAEPNSKITITDGSGNVIGTGITGSDGKFDVTPLTPAQINGQTLLATATDAADNKSDTAAAFAPDHIAPDAPTNVHINNEGTVVTGNAEAGSTVTVSDSNGNPLGSSQVGSDGAFTVTITPAQTNGETLEVSAKDNGGNVGPNTPVDAPDTTTPVLPVITHVIDDVANHTGDVANGATTNDSKPEIQGTAEEGSTVKIYDNGTFLGSTTAGAGGVWSFTPTTDLGQGLHNLTVTATDAGNNTSPAASFSVVVDTIAPQAPAITLVNDDASPITGPVQNNGSTNDQTPTLHGTGEPGSILTLLDGTTILTTLTIDASGTWSYTPTNPLSVGNHTFTVTAEDAVGNATLPSAGFTINVDITAPTTPVITTVQDDVGTIKGTLAPNGATDDIQPQVNGTGEPGSTVTLYDGSTAVGSALVGLDGKWSITPSQPLSEGPHTLNAIATDAAGNASTAATFSLTVDTTPPAAPFILTAEGNIGGSPTTLTSGGSTQSSAPTLTGSGEPGATINIYDNSGTTLIGTVIVPAGGTWTFTPTFGEGSHTLTAVATDPAGNVGLPSTGFILTVNSTPPTAPGIPAVTDDQAPGLGTISNGGSTNDTTPTISGTDGTAGDIITILDNGAPIGTTAVRADGSWSFTPVTPITGPDHVISVTESDQAGNKSPASGTVAFTLDTTPPDAPTITTADDNAGAVQLPLGTGSVTDDNTPTFHGTGVNGDTITLYSDNTVIGTATVSGGVWTITTTPLSDGPQDITATATDAAGNMSIPSADFTLTVYTTPLTAPVVTGIVDNVGAIQTPLMNGSVTDDTTPTFNGTGTVGSTVAIYDNGGTTPIGTAVVGANGTWTITLPALSETSHSLTVGATDPAGNSIGPSAPLVITVDLTPPLAPDSVVISNDGTVVTGNAEANSTVIIKDAGGNEIGRGTTTAGGTFTVTIAPAQTGSEALTAIAQDQAGNQGAAADFAGSGSGLPPAPVITDALDDVGAVTGPVANGGSTDDTTPTLNGTAVAGAEVSIYQDGILLTFIPPVIADISGNWSYQIPAGLSEGSHTFTVSQTVGSLASGQSPVFTITVDTTAPTAPVITSVADDVAPITGNVTSGQATNDPRPTITGSGEIGSTITILDNNISIGTALVGAGGTWTFTPSSDLINGSHPITVTSTDAAGNVSAPSTRFSVNVDTLTTAPVITTVADNVGTPGPVVSGVPTNDNMPTFTGTAEANSTLTISDNGSVIAIVPVDGTGNWTYTPNPALTDGSHNLTITATDSAGNVSSATTFNAVVDTFAPVVPAITLVVDDQTQLGSNLPLTNGQLTKDTLPTISGTSEANATITLYDGTTVIGTVKADGTGTWTLVPDAPLNQGSNILTVTATDAAGNISNPSSSFVVQVDSVAPTPPAILTVTDNTAPNIGPITSGQPTNETRPAITGSGEVGSTITVYDGSTALGTATVGTGGNWSFTPPTELGSGSHTLTVTATDPAGNISAPSASFNVVIDITTPVAPAITAVADDVGAVTGNLTNGQTTDDTRPAISGTAEDGSTVTLYDNGTLIGTAVAAGGVWNFTPGAEAPLGSGNHAFTATTTDTAGNVSPLSPAFNIVIDTTAPTAPIVIQAFDDVGPVTGPLVSGQSTNDSQPALSGTAEANSTVNIYDNGAFLGATTASPTGTWSFTPSTPLPNLVHVFTATSTDAAGNLGAVSGSFTLTIDTVAPTTPVLTSVVDDVTGGVFNNPLTSGQVTNDARPTLNGTAEVGSTVAIFDGATQIGSVTVPAGGNWTFTPTTPLTTGLHTFTITATDTAGNVSGTTTGFAITVDTTAPGTPVITSIVDDVAGGVFNNPLANNQTTNDNLPTLNGTAEAGSTVAIYDKGVFVTNVTASGTGAWTYTPTAPLPEGNHSFTVTATDLAGNISAPSLPSVIVVDTTPPAAPAALAVNATGTTVIGTAEAGSTVTITTSAGTVLGTATADGTGSFSVAITPAQTNSQALLAYAVDSAGNQGVSTGFTAPSTALPGVPVITSVVDDTAPVTGNVANGQNTNDNTPTINGTADVGATVSIYNNGVLMGTTIAGAGGIWTYTPTALGEGTHAFTATATNVNGTGSPSAVATVIVDTIAPLAPTATISADGFTISGTAEANSTVTITLPGGATVTTTANGNGAYSTTLPTREIGGEQLSVAATDAAGNVSPSVTAIAPILPLAADDNVINLALTSTATVAPPVHYSDYGALLVGALGNTLSVLGNDTAQVGFTIAAGGTGNITIDAAATGVVLSLLNTLEVAVQKYDSATNSWSTVIDSSLPQFASLLTQGTSNVTMNITGLPEGTYRVVSYNTNLVATGSLTSLNVSVEQISAGTITGGTTHPGNVITDIDPHSGQDTAPAGTLVTAVTNAQGTITQVGAGGADIQGQYGTLHINQDGSYTYTLTNTSASVIGRTENFTYTITYNGTTASAHLVVTLGNPTPASTVTATDNTASLTYSTDVEAVNHGASSQNGVSVLSVGVGNVLSANLLANMSNPIIFNVDDGSTRTMTLQASVGGVALLSTFDLYIYKFNDVTQQFEQYQVQKAWLTAPLLGGTSGQLTLALPGGEYLFLLNNASGVSVLTGYTLNILQDHTYAVESESATTTGNVLQDDIVTSGTGHVTQVNGVSIAATGTTTINGEYGVLTIDANGNYTYKLNAGVGADSIKTPDSFVYTVTATNGDTGTASLNITATPHAVDAVNDTSALMAVSTAQNTAVYSDTSVGSASWAAKLLSATSGSGNGTFVVANNDVLHNPVLHFTVQSLLSLGGLNVDWNITNSAGTVVKNGSFNGGLLLGGVANIDLSGLDLPAGTYTLNYTGNMGALAAGQITITPTITGTTLDIDSYSTIANAVHGNIYDGSDASGAVDQLGSVHSLLSITGYNGVTTTLNPLTDSSSTATIQGHYGTLVMGIDGSYTYTLNAGLSPAAITSKETFNYSLNDQNGHTDNATLTINMNPQFVSTAQSDVINGSVYGDTLVYHLLNSADATGGNGADTWNNFTLAQGDQINIHDLLVGWNPATSNIANYLTVTTSGNNTVISIDRDGTGATYHTTTLVTLENTQTTLDELVQQNHIVT